MGDMDTVTMDETAKTPAVTQPEPAPSIPKDPLQNGEVEESPPVRTRAPAPPTANYNVRELLELERKIYDESIEKQGRLYKALRHGTLHDYLVQCVPLENDRDRAIEVANTRLQLNRRNASDLLAFELKQADDIYQAHCLALKQRLRAAAQRKRARIIQRLEQIQQGLPLTMENDTDSHKVETEIEGDASPTETSIFALDGSLDTTALEKQLAASHAANLAAFNLQHLEHNLPPASAIVADVMEELERQRAYQKEVTDPDTVCGVVVDPKVGKVWIGLMDVYTVLDHVVVWSCLSDEEFYGQIIQVHSDRLDVALMCGSRMSVSVEQLRKQLCTLRQQGTPAPERLSLIDERMPRTPNRKRHRRKHTIGMRQKI